MALLLAVAVLGVLLGAGPCVGQQTVGRVEQFERDEKVAMAGKALIPQRAFETFDVSGVATFSSYRISREVYVVLTQGARTHLVWSNSAKDWSLNGTDLTCSLSTMEGATQGAHALGATPGPVLKGTLYVDARLDVYHPGPWLFVGLFCRVPGAPPVSQGTLGQVLHINIGPEVIYASPEDATAPEDEEESMDRQLLNMCAPPIYGTSPLRVVKEWVVYHQHHIGFDHIVFYLTQDKVKEFARLLDELWDVLLPNEYTVVDYRRSADFPSWCEAQALQINDCLHSQRKKAKWVAFGDFDEYISIQNLPPYNSLRFFLAKNATGCSEVNRGSFFMGIFCEGVLMDPSTDVQAVEMIEYMEVSPHCVTDMWKWPMNITHCQDWWGHRKGFVRTDAVYLQRVHTIDTPIFLNEAFPPIRQCNLSAYDAYNAHFRGLGSLRLECKQVPANETELFHRTRQIADVARDARLCRGQEEGAKDCWPRKTLA